MQMEKGNYLKFWRHHEWENIRKEFIDKNVLAIFDISTKMSEKKSFLSEISEEKFQLNFKNSKFWG